MPQTETWASRLDLLVVSVVIDVVVVDFVVFDQQPAQRGEQPSG
jgi:hypothetical protein